MTMIDVLCDPEMIKLLPPLEQSKPIESYSSPTLTSYVVAAVYDRDALMAIPEDRVEEVMAWWRQADGGSLVDLEDLTEDALKDHGVFGYLSHKGCTTERNVAAAMGDIASDLGMGWVEFGNWVVDNCPTPTQVEERMEALLAELGFGDPVRTRPASPEDAAMVLGEG